MRDCCTVTPFFFSASCMSVTCDTVLVTYWSQVCWKRAWGGGRGAQQWRDVTVSMTQGAFALADEGLLVPLHPLQLLVSTHSAPLLLLLCWVSRVQTLQGTFWSLLRAVGEKRVDNMGKAENKHKCKGKSIAHANKECKKNTNPKLGFTSEAFLRLQFVPSRLQGSFSNESFKNSEF